MRLIKYTFLFIVAFLGVTFAALNAQSISLNFFIGTYSLPLSLLLAITLILGCAFGLLTALSMYFKLKTENFRINHRLKLAEKEVNNLRTIPLKSHDD